MLYCFFDLVFNIFGVAIFWWLIGIGNLAVFVYNAIDFCMGDYCAERKKNDSYSNELK